MSCGILSITKFQLTLRLVVLADYRGRYWTISVPSDFHNHVGCGVWSSGEYIVKLREAIYDVISQALIFIIRREFMLVGWMVVYLISWVYLFHVKCIAHFLSFQVPNLQFLPAHIFILADG